MAFILADAWLITMNEQREVLDKASVCVEKDRIAAVGTRQDLERRFPTAEVVDCTGKIVMPGMVNTHTHLFQTLLKGLGDDMVLKKWFTCMTGPSAVHLMPEDAHAAAMHGCVESIRSGVTTLVDFMYVHTRPGMIKAVVEAFEETGMRGFVCRGFVSLGEEYGVPRELIEEPEHAIGDAREQMRRYNKPGGRIQVGVAPNMIWAVDEKGYRLTRKLADEEHALITTHVAETTFEIQTAASRYGQTDTEFLSEIGFLGPDVLAAHCVHCKPHDIRILRHHDAKVAHNPCSNMYLASGCPPIPEMLTAGVTVGLASDGPASSNNHSLFQAMKFAALIQKGFHQDADDHHGGKSAGDGDHRWRSRGGPGERNRVDGSGKKGGPGRPRLRKRVHDADSSSRLGDRLLRVGARSDDGGNRREIRDARWSGVHRGRAGGAETGPGPRG